jgi:hypothetical protein
MKKQTALDWYIQETQLIHQSILKGECRLTNTQLLQKFNKIAGQARIMEAEQCAAFYAIGALDKAYPLGQRCQDASKGVELFQSDYENNIKSTDLALMNIVAK